jgi:hypothetical protein
LLKQTRLPISQIKHDQRTNNREGGEWEISNGKPVSPTARCPVARATRWNIAGFHGEPSLSAFDAEQASRALVFEACVENSCARPHLSLPRIIHRIVRLGDLLHANIRQHLPRLSPGSHHHKLALPIEAVRARASILSLRAWQAPDFFELEGRGATSFPSPINNGRVFQDAG